MIIPFTYLNDLMRNAALGTPTILPKTFEYLLAIALAVATLVFGFVAFNRIEQDARAKGNIATS